jgi:hypothetical protein
VADDLERSILIPSANVHCEYRFDRPAGFEVIELFPRIENRCFTDQMALFTNAVSGVRSEPAGVDDIASGRLGNM